MPRLELRLRRCRGGVLEEPARSAPIDGGVGHLPHARVVVVPVGPRVALHAEQTVTAETVVEQRSVGGRQRRRDRVVRGAVAVSSEEHTSELQSLMCMYYAVVCLKKEKQTSTVTTLN